jgi:hypothetical protein
MKKKTCHAKLNFDRAETFIFPKAVLQPIVLTGLF